MRLFGGVPGSCVYTKEILAGRPEAFDGDARAPISMELDLTQSYTLGDQPQSCVYDTYSQTRAKFKRALFSLTLEGHLDTQYDYLNASEILDLYSRFAVWGEQSGATLPWNERDSLDSKLRKYNDLVIITVNQLELLGANLEQVRSLVERSSPRNATEGESLSNASTHADSCDEEDLSSNGSDFSEEGDESSSQPLPLPLQGRKFRFLTRQVAENVKALYRLSTLLRRPQIESAPQGPSSIQQFASTDREVQSDVAQVFEIVKQWNQSNDAQIEEGTLTKSRADERLNTDILDFSDQVKRLIYRLANANTKRREQMRSWSQKSSNVTSDVALRETYLLDLQPYMCTFADCQTPDKLYATRKEWIYHQTQMHRVQWVCSPSCGFTTNLQEAFRGHLRDQHGDEICEKQIDPILELCRRPMDDDLESACPLCRKVLPLAALFIHIGKHHEDICLLVARPAIDAQNEDRRNFGSESLGMEPSASTWEIGKSSRSTRSESASYKPSTTDLGRDSMGNAIYSLPKPTRARRTRASSVVGSSQLLHRYTREVEHSQSVLGEPDYASKERNQVEEVTYPETNSEIRRLTRERDDLSAALRAREEDIEKARQDLDDMMIFARASPVTQLQRNERTDTWNRIALLERETSALRRRCEDVQEAITVQVEQDEKRALERLKGLRGVGTQQAVPSKRTSVKSVTYDEELPPSSSGTKPVYPKFRRADIALETLDYYKLSWEYDRHDDDFVIILADLSERETDILFEHTKRLRSTRPRDAYFDRESEVMGISSSRTRRKEENIAIKPSEGGALGARTGANALKYKKRIEWEASHQLLAEAEKKEKESTQEEE